MAPLCAKRYRDVWHDLCFKVRPKEAEVNHIGESVRIVAEVIRLERRPDQIHPPHRWSAPVFDPDLIPGGDSGFREFSSGLIGNQRRGDFGRERPLGSGRVGLVEVVVTPGAHTGRAARRARCGSTPEPMANLESKNERNHVPSRARQI